VNRSEQASMRWAVRGSALLFAALLISPPALSQSKVASTKKSDAPAETILFGSVELRHQVNSFYDRDGFLLRQEPSAQMRTQIGARLYDRLADLYVTLGAYKVPQTQQILPRRPEIGLDLWPFNGETFSMLFYNVFQPPFRSAEDAPADRDQGDMDDVRSGGLDGGILTTGLAPSVRQLVPVGSGRLILRAGSDVWTRMYSRKQYLSDRQPNDESPRFSLTGRSSETDETGDGAAMTDREDYALHYATQYFATVGVGQSWLPQLTGEIGGYYDTRYLPVYAISEDGSSYRYTADRFSHVRVRLQYALTDRATLSNEFYQYQSGLFAAQRYDGDRRYRNLLRLNWRM